MCSVAFHHAPNPTSGTRTQRLGPLLKPTVDYLGLKTGQRGVSKGLSEIKLMECVSVPSHEDWGEDQGGEMWGLLSPLPSFSHIDHHGNQSPLLPR